jgi:hypothetical protein
MPEDFSHLPEDEKLKAENDFLKMKMMLENGADFHIEKDLPPDLENEFLNRILAFEKQAANPKYIKIYDKLQRPTHFKPVAEIPDSEIEAAWTELRNYMGRYHIDLDVCSPNVTVRELYRFTTEELFEEETDDMDVPGMITSYIYDEFHPDYVYDNTRYAVEDCIKYILNKNPMEFMAMFRSKNLAINEHSGLSEEEFKKIVNRFKNAYDSMQEPEITNVQCNMADGTCDVTGTYAVTVMAGTESLQLSGNWLVQSAWDDEMGGWDIWRVQMEGIKF